MYTNETTHFGIPLPLGSDLTTPMDYNTAAEAVDEALYEAQGDAATANENAAAAVETANAVSEALDTLSGTVGGHTSQISALGARMTNAENEIDDVRSDLEDMIVAFNEPTATSTHAYAIGDYFIYNDVLYKATAAISVGETIVPNTNCSATNVMTEVSAGGGGSVAAADVTLDPITGMSADDVQEGIEELKTALSDFNDYTLINDFTANGQTASFDATTYKFIYICGGTSVFGFDPSLTPVSMLRNEIVTRLSSSYYYDPNTYAFGGVLAVSVVGNTITLTSQDFFKGTNISGDAHVRVYGIK